MKEGQFYQYWARGPDLNEERGTAQIRQTWRTLQPSMEPTPTAPITVTITISRFIFLTLFWFDLLCFAFIFHFCSLWCPHLRSWCSYAPSRRARQNLHRKPSPKGFTNMDDYTREMMDLKTLVTRTLEKKGVLAKIRVIFSLFHLILVFWGVLSFKFLLFWPLPIFHCYSLYWISWIFWGSCVAGWWD